MLQESLNRVIPNFERTGETGLVWLQQPGFLLPELSPVGWGISQKSRFVFQAVPQSIPMCRAKDPNMIWTMHVAKIAERLRPLLLIGQKHDHNNQHEDDTGIDIRTHREKNVPNQRNNSTGYSQVSADSRFLPSSTQIKCLKQDLSMRWKPRAWLRRLVLHMHLDRRLQSCCGNLGEPTSSLEAV